MRYQTIIALLAMLALPAGATERTYQEAFCDPLGGSMEHILSDRTRVDCLTATHAIEVDYGRNWAEAIGQALHYGMMTGKQPGILLILESPSDQRYLTRIYQIINHWHLPIQVWTVRGYDDDA